MTDLPESWEQVEIVEVLAKTENGKPFQQGWSPQCESYPADPDRWGVLKTTAIQHGEFRDHENKALPTDLDPRPQIEVRAGDVLMTCAGPRNRCGVACLVERTRPHLMMSGKMYRFRPHPEALHPKYLAYLIQRRETQLQIDLMKTGISDSGLNLTHDRFGQLGVPLAPLPEQHRIVAKIEALFSELDKAVESLTLARAQLKTYRQALLDAATDGRLLTWKGQRNCPFGDDQLRPLLDLVKEMGQGWSPQCLNTRAIDDKTWAVMKTTAIQHLAFDDTENKELPADLTPRTHLELVEGDLLITRAGPRTRVGVACLVRSVRPRLILCDKAYRIRIRENLALPEYVELLLNAPRTLWEIEQIKSGISDSGLNLTQSKFLALQLFVPTLPEQRAILDHLSEVLSNVDRQEIEIDTAFAKANALRQSILKQAFSGQLVAQDPADEPASALLARLRGTVNVPKTRRKKTA